MNGEMISLTASDGHTLAAYKAEPAGAPKGGVVILQEIFGITNHIKSVVDQYAAEGYVAIAPAVFDRVERGAVLKYTNIERGKALVQALNPGQVMLDTKAALDDFGNMPTAVVGYCWGGAMAFIAAAKLPIDAAVSYYGGQIPMVLPMQPLVPVLYHFGGEDGAIPANARETIVAADPNGEFHVYEGAGHGFNCTDRSSFHAEAASMAFERTLDFMKTNFAKKS